MAAFKVQFANSELEITTVKDNDGELWLLANPFARILEYSNAPNAINKFVSEKNQKCYKNIDRGDYVIKSARIGLTVGRPITSSLIQPKSKFINRAGLFELIQASQMPKAKEFREWINSDLLPMLCEDEDDMAVDAPMEIADQIETDGESLLKIEFVNGPIEVFTVTDESGENWMVANPFAEALGYNNINKAIRIHVSEKNQNSFENIQPTAQTKSSNIQAKTKFINRAGVFELINASDMPAAKRFKAWNTNELLPTLCQEGEYSMATDAPSDIAVGMNAVHVATNDGADAPWMKDLAHLKTAIVEKDKKIDTLTLNLAEANTNLAEANKVIMSFANEMIVARKDCELARKETAELANRMADIAQDVIAKPSDPQLLHSLAVCDVGGDQYAFLRPQKRSLNRSLSRLSVDEKDIVYKSDYVPNAMNVLNKIKERLPKGKYKAHHNRITLHKDLTREDLLRAIESTVTPRQVSLIINRATTSTNNANK
ncbi:bro-B [Cnaphalocrocis medinalis granulovirus]|uniref:Bro-B n=1 Tax=Cnaphalocrocis medinalis granulovirus TaxID=1750712 RepID=A0A120L159_9BBAC|nr:bro-B [Cnaphalocrocis medinalis granulovirus]AMF83837.1 bro-B [Cnaphalocrocis medinalis granulovirus]